MTEFFNIYQGICSDGWVENCDRCYKFMMTNAIWTQADGLCRDLGAQLVTIDSEQKSAFLNGFVFMTPGVYFYTIITGLPASSQEDVEYGGG